MNRRRSFAALIALPFCLAIAPPALHAQAARTPKDPHFETTARSLVRLDALARQLADGIARQAGERRVIAEDLRGEIAVSTAGSLRRATTCLKRRFFDGADSHEIEDRVREIDELAERVRTAGARLGLYAHLREKLAAYLNERDWLMRHLGLERQ